MINKLTGEKNGPERMSERLEDWLKMKEQMETFSLRLISLYCYTTTPQKYILD